MWQYMLGVFVLYGPPLAPTKTLSTGSVRLSSDSLIHATTHHVRVQVRMACEAVCHGALQEKTLIVQIHLAFSATWYSLRQVKLSEEGLTLPGA